MRMTLRRSCAACAKAKHSCDLRTPQCTRCVKRKSSCVYANEPLTSLIDANGAGTSAVPAGPARNDEDDVAEKAVESSALIVRAGSVAPTSSDVAVLPFSIVIDSFFDPFDSLPQTRLPRVRVQRLIHHFLSKIAFQYYPLDLNPGTNPFIVSWWPLALADPALFHVSLQTASLDDELMANKGFPISEVLMADSVSLIRKKIEDPIMALQDATMDSVVTLAAIEHGKGNFEISKMHIDGVKRMVSIRGGIAKVKSTSPLTARMVSWVSMLIFGSPQFPTQDDFGHGNGLAPNPQWLSAKPDDSNLFNFEALNLDHACIDILGRLRHIFHQSQLSGLSTNDLQDLTSFVLHRLLILPPPIDAHSRSAIVSESVRNGTIMYMFIIHGPVYYSQAHVLNTLTLKLKEQIQTLVSMPDILDPLIVWLVSIGMVASLGTLNNNWFSAEAGAIMIVLGLQTWTEVLDRLESILWLQTHHGEPFRQMWEKLLAANH